MTRNGSLRWASAFLAVAVATINAGCDRFFEFYNPSDGRGTGVSRIFFASDTVNPLAAAPLPVYDPTSSEIWSIKPDGTDLRRLTRNDLDDGQPSVSRNGQTIVFAGDSRVETFAAVYRQLFIMNADGSRERELSLSSNADEYDPAISPDGQYVAFISDRDGNAELYVGQIEGSVAMRISATVDAEEATPAWSPDGNWLVVIRRSTKGEGAELWRYANPYSPILGPPGPVNITALVRHNDPDFLQQYNRWANPDWSPNGTSIAFSADYEGPLDWYIPSQVFLVDMRSFTITDPEDPTERYIDYSIEEDPNWSADGSQLVFSARDPSAPKLVIIRSSGLRLGEIFLGRERRCWQPDWSYSPTR